MSPMNYLSFIVLSASFMSGHGSMSTMPQDMGSSQDLTAIKIEMVPSGLQAKAAEAPYRVGPIVRMRVIAKNNSDERIRVTIVDTYYQNRPRLYKNGRLVGYRAETTKLVRSKDEDPEFVRPGSFVFLEPYSRTDLEELSLNDWYGPLEPGVYRLINRHRFAIDGPWTSESAELVFEVIPQ